MAKRLSFHIQQNLTPRRLQAILEVAVRGHPSLSKLASECQLEASVVAKVLLPFVRQLGILSAEDLSLSELGELLVGAIRNSPSMLPEAVHHLLYTAHAFDSTKRFSWAYAQVVDALWTSGQRTLDSKASAQLVGMVVEEAAQRFGVLTENIAFSRDSIRGVLNWLRELDPPVVSSNGRDIFFRRRYFCPAPSLLWAMDFCYRTTQTGYGVRMFLTPERVEQICKLCALDPSGLENVLMMAKRTSDYDKGGIFGYGTEGGFGRWLLLVHPCRAPEVPGGDAR